MYQPKIEAMPRELKDALLIIGDLYTIDDIMSLEDANSSSKSIASQIFESLSDISLPDFWIVTFKGLSNVLFFLVFETKLSNEEELKFLKTIEKISVAELISKESISEEYSIY